MSTDHESNGPVAQVQARDHTPAVSSPLNPDHTSTKPRTSKPPPREREQRERKDSSKKREADGHQTRTSTTSTIPAKRKASEARVHAPAPAPIRSYRPPNPKLSDYEPPKEVTFAPHEPAPFFTPDGSIEMMRPLDV